MSVMLCPCIFLCCSVNVFVCLFCELFGETIRNVFRCVGVVLVHYLILALGRKVFECLIHCQCNITACRLQS